MSLYSAIPIGAANTPKDLLDVIVGTVGAMFHPREAAKGIKGVVMGTGMNMLNLEGKQASELLGPEPLNLFELLDYDEVLGPRPKKCTS